jgi:hypothetical protein
MMLMHKWFMIYQAEESGDDVGSSGGSAASAPAEELGGGDTSLDSDVNWDDLDTSFDEPDVEGDLEILGDGSPAKPADESPAPSTPPAQAAPPAAPAAAPTSPVAAPAPVAPVAQVPQSAPPPQTQGSAPAELPSPEVYQNWRAGRLGELEQHYTFTEDESAALLTEPELVLPKLAAKVHMEVLENSMRAMQAMVPLVMEQYQQHTQVETSAKSLFSTINPDLVDPRFEPVILQLGATYRQMNRTAGPEEASRAIGNLVRAALNMQSFQPQQSPQGSAPAPVAAPFAPVRGGGGGSRPPVSSNPFEQLASEFMSDEDNY